jgi:hypothetical protein
MSAITVEPLGEELQARRLRQPAQVNSRRGLLNSVTGRAAQQHHQRAISFASTRGPAFYPRRYGYRQNLTSVRGAPNHVRVGRGVGCRFAFARRFEHVRRDGCRIADSNQMEGGRGVGTVRRTSTHFGREHPIVIWRRVVRLQLQSVQCGGVRLEQSGQNRKWMDNGFADDDRLDVWNSRLHGRTAEIVFAVVMMRTLRVARSVVRVMFFGMAVLSGIGVRVVLMRSRVVVAVFGSRGRAVPPAPEKTFDAAIGTRQQPKHDRHRRSNAEGKVDFRLPANHTFNSSFIVQRRSGRGIEAATHRPGGKV